MPSNSDPVPLEVVSQSRNESVGRLLLWGSRDFQARSAEKLTARGYQGLSPSHTMVLVHVDVAGTRLIDLATRAGITKQSMSQLVQDLETAGYVTRTPDPVDHRAFLIGFTANGQQFLQDAFYIKQEIEQEYAQIIGDDGLQQLKTLLTALTAERGQDRMR